MVGIVVTTCGIDPVRSAKLLMRTETDALGFVTETALTEAEQQGRLRSQIDNGEWVGYLLHSKIRFGRAVHVWQECIDKSARRYGSGQRLFDGFERDCLAGRATAILLRCGEDLESRFFWAAMGFRVIGVDMRPKRRRRAVLQMCKDLPGGLFATHG